MGLHGRKGAEFDHLAIVEQGVERLLQVPRAAKLGAVNAVMGRDICFQVTCSQRHRETPNVLLAAFQVFLCCNSGVQLAFL